MIDREHDLPITKQVAALNISRGSVYYLPGAFENSDSSLPFCYESIFGWAGRAMMIVKALSEAVRIKKPRSETSVLRRIWRPAFHGLARGTIVGALGDTHTPAIPIR